MVQNQRSLDKPPFWFSRFELTFSKFFDEIIVDKKTTKSRPHRCLDITVINAHELTRNRVEFLAKFDFD